MSTALPNKPKLALSLLAAASISACSSSTSEPPSATETLSDSFSSMLINASSTDSYTYVNLITGEDLNLSDAQAESSDNWHIAFKRVGVKLNGGDSGPGSVSGALAAAQEDFYDGDTPDANIFLNATAASEEEHLLATYDLGTLEFINDSNTPAIQASRETNGAVTDLGWYNYDYDTHAVSLNDENWWIVRSNTGDSYAKFHATAFAYDRNTTLDVTFTFEVQDEGETAFTDTATFNASVATSGGSDCFDFDTNSAVLCSSGDWDIKLEINGYAWNLWTNGGVSGEGSGAAFGPLSTADANAYTRGDQDPAGSTTAYSFITDISEGVFSNTWYAYNLQGMHKLYPNYRTYLIDTAPGVEESPKFTLQLTNYYDPTTDASGYITIRYAELETE